MSRYDMISSHRMAFVTLSGSWVVCFSGVCLPSHQFPGGRLACLPGARGDGVWNCLERTTTFGRGG